MVTTNTNSPIKLDESIKSQVKSIRKKALARAEIYKTYHTDRAVAVNLTYAPSQAWDKNQISACFKCVREWARRKNIVIRYMWFLHIKDDRIHYHAIVWLPREKELPKFDVKGWWPHGATKVEAVKNIHKYINYLIGGLCLDQKQENCGLKNFSSFRGSKIQEDEKPIYLWIIGPKFLRLIFDEGDDISKERGYFIDNTTGFGVASPWELDLQKRCFYFKGLNHIKRSPFYLKGQKTYQPFIGIT